MTGVAARLDVSGRLAEGREALQDMQTYVSACSARGYRHPDLTAHPGQLGDWYDGDDGLDLRVLDADCAELWAVASAADDSLRAQRAELDGLAAAWRGPGAEAALEFLRRHCDTGEMLVAGLQATAQGCARLRDQLWRLVDANVATTTGVGERAGAQRSAWLGAAHAVLAGGDQQAGEVIDGQVMPFVDNDIRGEWLTAVRPGRSEIGRAHV